MVDSFQFLQPLWLLALLPLTLLVWLLYRRRGEDNPWRRIVDAAMLRLLIVEGKGGHRILPLGLLSIGWTVAVLALANPSWDKQKRPLFQSGQARILVLDLSSSMLANDLKPSRLERARFKVADILARQARDLSDSRNGLVAFAGDAFVVAPLTRDTKTIDAMLRALDPRIMPVQGGRVDLALNTAGKLLHQAGVTHGEVLLFTDGYTDDQALEVAQDLRQQGHRVSVLGVGTAEGAPVPAGKGNFLRDNAGNVVVPRLDSDALQALANAGGGAYTIIRNDDADLDQLLRAGVSFQQERAEATQMESETWIERGPWLVLLLLPLAALAFRRGWLLGLFALLGSGLPPQEVLAFDWQDLWQRQEQQAMAALEAGDPTKAAEIANDPLRRGVAHYRAGDYSRALEEFKGGDGADAAYNQGNALARLGDYPKAIEAYDHALELMPEMEDAQANRSAVENILQQQQQQQSSQSSDQESQQEQQAAKESGEGGEQAENNAQSQGEEPDATQQPQNGAGSNQSESQAGDMSQESDSTQLDASSQSKSENQFAEAVNEGAQQQDQADAASSDNTDSELEPGTAEESIGSQPGEDQQRKGNSALQEGEDAGETTANAAISADVLSSEEQMAAEQWLRRIPDDPGGLLRRKFLYQYRQRPSRSGSGSQQPW